MHQLIAWRDPGIRQEPVAVTRQAPSSASRSGATDRSGRAIREQSIGDDLLRIPAIVIV